VALGAILFCGAGCGSPAGGAAPPAGTCDLSAVTAIDPAVGQTATADDVQRVLKASCSLGGCHAAAPGAGDLALPVASKQWRVNLVDRRSQENPELFLIEAGNPARSWLMQKVTGQFCAARSCAPRLGCGERMPFGQSLSTDDMTTIYSWIRAGASP
jgi:hypothetical protein